MMLPFSAGRVFRMCSATPYFRTREFLLALASLPLPFAFASYEVNLGLMQHNRMQAEMRFKLAIPTLPPNGFQPLPPPYGSGKPLLQSFLGVPQQLVLPSGQPEAISLPPSGDGSSDNQYLDKMLVMAYYPDWLGATFPPSQINFTLFDWIDFAFAVPNAKSKLTWDDSSAPQRLVELVTAAHEAGTKVKLSIGGWTGSKHFSSAVASNKSRTTFVNSIVKIYQSFGVDGIDIDWEYPGREGNSGNHFRSTDSTNFLLFLKHLRQTLPSTARISAAVDTMPFVDNEGKPMADVSEFAEVLDWVLIMNYDAWGSSSYPGPNAPLHDACNNSSQPEMNAVAAYNAWTAAQFPASKLVLGLPSYGYISSSTATHLKTRNKSMQRKKSTENSNADFVTVISTDGGSDHQVQFRELIEQGALVKSASIVDGIKSSGPTFLGSGGFERMWDGCSDTPYLRSVTSEQIITYDDPESLGMKAAFAREMQMLGVNLFDVHGDSDQWNLLNSVIRAIV